MRSRLLFALSSGLMLFGCPKVDRKAADTACVAGETFAAVRVHVEDAATASPVPAASVSTSHLWGGDTDDRGVACIANLPAGEVTIRAWRVGFSPDSVTTRIEADHVGEVRFALQRTAAPCCRLAGTWLVRFELDRPSAMHLHPKSHSAEGLVVFSDRLPNPAPHFYELRDSLVRFEFAHTSVDFSPFFGGRVARDVSTTVFGPGGETLFREVVGIVAPGDSVSLTFIPRMTHGSMALWGRIQRDTIRGRWVQNAYCCGAEGRFTMHRVRWTREADFLIAGGLREYERERRAIEAAAAERRRREGHVRVRVYDKAVGGT